jgi:DNA-binding MarR family transcriptional regulator
MQIISTTDLAHRLRPVIARLSRRMRQHAGGDLSATQIAALNTISCHGPLTPSEVAARERIQRPTATRTLARLEESGLIARTADPADRRSSLVMTTEAGEALMASSRARKDAYLASHLDRLTAEELAVLDRAADILERVLEEGAE